MIATIMIIMTPIIMIVMTPIVLGIWGTFTIFIPKMSFPRRLSRRITAAREFQKAQRSWAKNSIPLIFKSSSKFLGIPSLGLKKKSWCQSIWSYRYTNYFARTQFQTKNKLSFTMRTRKLCVPIFEIFSEKKY